MTPSFEFLKLDELFELHRHQIETFGGSMGVRDMGLLESAMAQPEAAFSGTYLHSDVFEMAAAYLFHIVKNHPFVDGNKRVGLHAALTFLDLNGFHIESSSEILYAMTIEVATDVIDKRQAGEFFRVHAQEIDSR